MIVALDASPLSLLTQRYGIPEADDCRKWAASLVAAGVKMVIPSITDYEVRRELLRAGKATSIARLDALQNNPAFEFLPVSDAALLRAAVLWADARRRGLPTAAPSELDCDIVMVAIIQSSPLPLSDVIVATTNVGHLSRFLPAQNWRTLQP
jgi:predicted nucleic acid-binding protein